MDRAGDSLSPSFAIAIRARREAVRRVKADLQARGMRLSYVSPRDVRMVANKYLATHPESRTVDRQRANYSVSLEMMAKSNSLISTMAVTLAQSKK